MLIYAFRDARGTWHGDPDAVVHDARPGRGVLTLPHTAPGQAPGPFDGQRVEVRYAACDGEASRTSYRLDDGGSFAATRHVHELLSPARHRARTATAAERDATTVRLETGNSRRRYLLHADVLADGRADITVVVCDADGVVHGELTGEMDTCDLSEISRLLTSAGETASAAASPDCVSPALGKATRPGRAWSPEAVDYLTAHHRAGKSPKQLAVELGRSEESIRWKLYGLRLAPRPSDPAEPEVPKAYTVEAKRRLYPNAYKPWKSQDEQRLAQRCTQDASMPELSQEFGRNEGAITSRLPKIRAEGPAAEDAREYGG
ncbi:hypothetical protein ACIBCM_06900 [Streptomyces sp. NPDC051018]|uniref:hypothetical protein n=1 Tax=Streptomyces sp. NPDC051018 TaxID=3365639 RepID=UPI0037B99440